MADEKPGVKMGTFTGPKEPEIVPDPPREDKTPEVAEKIRSQKKARVAQVLSQGILNTKLKAIYDAAVPRGRVGKFVRDNDEDIMRYQNLGYTFEVNEGAIGLHGTGDGRVRVGDVVLMTISRDDLEILREVKSEKTKSKIGEGKREYTRLAEAHADRGGPTPIKMD